MMKLCRLIIAVLVLSFTVSLQMASAQEIDYKGLPQLSLHKKDSTEYVLYTPGRLEPGKRYPIALFLHGCCGTSYHATLRNAVDPPMRMWHEFGANKQRVPTYIISPATSRGWRQHRENLKAVIDDLIANHQGDSQRVYICGFSMGGQGTAEFLAAYPNFFAAAMIMGMNIRAGLDTIHNIPLWVNRGSEDYYSKGLPKQVAEMRHLNGAPEGDSTTTNTGVNPRFTDFVSREHGIQWEAASLQDMVGWAYSKVNDGNAYPNVWFTSHRYGQEFKKGQRITVHADANDPDGNIIKTEFFVNGRLTKTLRSAPFVLTLSLGEGDTYVEAKVYDDKGKTANTTTKVFVRQKPAIGTNPVPHALLLRVFDYQFTAVGNGPFIFALDSGSSLPPNFVLYPDGRLRGLAILKGDFPMVLKVTDQNGQTASRKLVLTVSAAKKNAIVIRDAKNKAGSRLVVSRMGLDETPTFDSKDTVLRDELPEAHFSDIGLYSDLLFIKTDQNDANSRDPEAVSLQVDGAVEVLVAYETLDSQFTSTIPDWLKEYTKKPGQIVAQYRYYDVYSRQFPLTSLETHTSGPSIITLPGADAATNKVSSNYFIMLRPIN